ncbi:hypothetical protein RIF29_14256 [Crotalaria pallida]|uniref:TF-B3 domain-containing protein n=1 Tax=Crotalaria pallida TaxID=3830 RepID=A0AAN9FAZ6_CROPI
MNPPPTKHDGHPGLPSKVLHAGFSTFVVQLCGHNMEDGTEPFLRSFIEDYLTTRAEHEVLLIHNDNSRVAGMSTHQLQSTCFITNGWQEFAIANGITDEEECKINVVGVNDAGQIMMEFHKITI